MPLPLISIAGAALWSTGRWAVTRVAPAIIGRVTGLFTKKLSVGGALAMSASPTAISFIDRQTDHAISETLLNTPVGPAIEILLKANEWANDQKASIVSNLILNHLIEKQVINETDLDYEQSKRLINAIGHVMVGDKTGAASLATDLGINESDILSAYNEEKEKNPDAKLPEIGPAIFNNLREKVRQRNVRQEISQPETATGPQETLYPQTGLYDLKPDRIKDSERLILIFNNAVTLAGVVAAKTGQDVGWQFNIMSGLTKFVNLIKPFLFGMADGLADVMTRNTLKLTQNRVKEMLDGDTVGQGTLDLLGNLEDFEPILKKQVTAPALDNS